MAEGQGGERPSRRHLAAVTAGNALEFYDFITYAFFAAQIGRTFFPGGGPFVSLMLSLATFGAGFVTRPIGAAVLGGYADRVGRRPAMVLSFTLMGGSIGVLALTPSYAAIGVAAPVIAVLARLVQGFSLGGEVGSSSAYMMEVTGEDRRARAVTLQGIGQLAAGAVASLVGLALSSAMSPAMLDGVGWRIAMLLGTAAVPFGLAMRRSLPETIHLPEPDGVPAARIGRTALLGLAIIAGGTIATYLFNYMATYGQSALGLSAQTSFAASLVNRTVGIPALWLGATLSDRIGRRSAMVWPQILFLLAVLPAFWWITRAPGAVSLIGANLVLGFLSQVPVGGVYTAIMEGLPRSVRSRGFALIYAVAVAVFGGTTQLVATWLIHASGSAFAPAWYLTGVGTIALGAMALMPETAPAALRRRARRLAPALA